MQSTYNYNTPAWITAIIMSHLTSPLAIAWFLLTRNDMYIQMGTFTYGVTARHAMGGSAQFGTFHIPETSRSQGRVIMFQVAGGKVRLYRRVSLKFFPRCPDQSP